MTTGSGGGDDGGERGDDATAANRHRNRHENRHDGRHQDRHEGREFGWRGWVLVGFVVVAFFVVPGALYALAYAREFVTSFGLGWRQAYLVFPLVPALILGALAVWATTRP